MRRLILAFVVLFASALAVAAQEKPQSGPAKPAAAAEPPADQPELVPLKITLVISRAAGGKKVGSMSYTLGVAPNSNKSTLRMVSDVPVPTGSDAAAVSYRNVGTVIECEARSALQAGVYRLFITVNDSSVLPETAGTDAAGARRMPHFRSLNTSFVALLREGETAQYTSATDPVSGEMMSIDVTLNALR